MLLKLLCCQLLLKPPSLRYFGLKPERICFHSVLQENKPEPDKPLSVRWQSGISCILQVSVSGDSCEVKGEGHLVRGKHLDQG